MNFKKLIIGGVTGGIILFFLGWLFYGMLLVDFMKNNPGIVSGYEKEMPDMLYLAIGNLAAGLLLAYIFIRANINTLMGGLIFATIAGFLMAVSFDCMMYGTTNLLSKKAIMADVLTATAMYAITGSVVGMLLGKIK